MKKRIMLICAAGMSTSLLVTKMQKAAHELGEYVEIFALGPQVRYAKTEIESIIEESGKKIPYAIIDMKDYGLMDGKTVFAKAMKLMSK